MICLQIGMFMLFSACPIHSCGSSVHAIASLDSFTSVFCHVEFVWRWFHVAFFCPPVWHLRWVVVCSSKPYVNKLILRSSRPSTSLYALTIKAIPFLHTKCFIKTEFTRVHSHSVYNFGVYVTRRIHLRWLRGLLLRITSIHRTKDLPKMTSKLRTALQTYQQTRGRPRARVPRSRKHAQRKQSCLRNSDVGSSRQRRRWNRRDNRSINKRRRI